MPEDQALALLPSRLTRLTPNTIDSRERLQAELTRIRREGVAFDREEHTEGICAAGAAILNASGPVAAISVPVPVQRFEGEEGRLAKQMKAAAAAASELLGGRQPTSAQ